MEHNTDRILWTVLVLAIGVALYVIFRPAANGLLSQTTEKIQTVATNVNDNTNDSSNSSSSTSNTTVGTNLIIISDLKNGCIYSNGSLGSNTVDFHSDNYIPTNGETMFTFSSPDYVFKGNDADDRIAMYDSNKNYLGSQPITSATQTLSKSNVAYIRFSINSADEGNTTRNSSDWLANHRYKLEKGSVSTPYIP